MSVFLVSCNASRIDQVQPALIAAIIGFPNTNLHGAVWLVEFPGSVGMLRDRLRQHMAPSETLFVSQLSGAWASFNMDAAGRWLQDRGL